MTSAMRSRRAAAIGQKGSLPCPLAVLVDRVEKIGEELSGRVDSAAARVELVLEEIERVRLFEREPHHVVLSPGLPAEANRAFVLIRLGGEPEDAASLTQQEAR